MPQLTLQLDNDPTDFPLSSKVGPAIAFGSALALLAAASGDLLLSLRGVGRSAELVTGTYQVIDRAGDLLPASRTRKRGNADTCWRVTSATSRRTAPAAGV